MVEAVFRVWTTHEWIRDIAATQGVLIYNATAGGFLDLFPRVKFGTLFAETGQ